MKKCLLFFAVLFCLGRTANGQICTGSKGDPIINITFGTTRQPVPKATTNLNYVGGCPFDTSSYTIQNLIFGCGETPSAKSWHMLAGDHTKDNNGKYMLVNASWYQGVTHPPQIIYTDTATGLCGNSSYEFSAWLANPMSNLACGGNPLLPDVRFSVTTLKGDTIASSNSGPLAVKDSRTWQKNGVAFGLPAGVSAVILTVWMDVKLGCGNALVVDDITLAICGPSVNATIDGQAGPADVCADYTVPFLLSASYSPGFNDPVVRWQSSLDYGRNWVDIPGSTTTNYNIPRRTSGAVFYRMGVAERSNINSPNCRVASNAIFTEVHPVPPHNPPTNIIGCLGKDLRLPQADVTSLKNEWTGPNNFLSNNPKAIVLNVSIADTGMYLLKQEFYYGCTSLDTFYLKVFPSATLTTQTLYGICEGQTIQLAASGTGTFQWTPGTGLSNPLVANPVITPRDSAVYKVVITNTFGCKDSAEVTINVFRRPVVTAPPGKTIVKGDSLKLMGTATGTAIVYSWTPATFITDPLSLTPIVYPGEETRYTINATSTVGCGTATASTLVSVYTGIFIPSAFTPNGDGKNDYFRIIAADGYKLIRFQVFNRWGRMIFNAKSTSDGWNGTLNGMPQATDTYTYILEIENTQKKKILRSGTVNLVR